MKNMRRDAVVLKCILLLYCLVYNIRIRKYSIRIREFTLDLVSSEKRAWLQESTIIYMQRLLRFKPCHLVDNSLSLPTLKCSVLHLIFFSLILFRAYRFLDINTMIVS